MKNSRFTGEGKLGRCLRHGVAALIGSMILMALSGCYWTPGQAQGAISLRITPAENDLAAQELDNSGILLVFVMDESVLRSSPEEAERFFTTVETSSSTEIGTLLELDHDEFESSRFELDYPSTQFQGTYARFEPGSSGARTFSGLTAGAGYLVVVEAHGSSGIEQIGYDVVTVNRGKSRQVDLVLDNNLGHYHAFLADRYGYSPVDRGDEVDVEVEEVVYTIGDIGPAGGIVFYDKGAYSDGWRYLETAPESTEWTLEQWSADSTEIGGDAQLTGIGDGQAATDAIVQHLADNTSETDRAAQLSDTLSHNGFDDWFLPSKDELNTIWENLVDDGDGNNSGVGGFASATYWSSSESEAPTAWSQTFVNGNQFVNLKNSNFSVRAVRAF